MEPAFVRATPDRVTGNARAAGSRRRPINAVAYDAIVREAHADDGNFCRGIAIAVAFSMPIWIALGGVVFVAFGVR